MTKVSILDEESKGKKKIEFLGCLEEDCYGTNYDNFNAGFLDPSTHDEIILISRNYGDKDVMLSQRNGEDYIMFGHFNDGVV